MSILQYKLSIRKKKEKSDLTCVCLCDTKVIHSSSIKCRNGHHICEECLVRYINRELDTFEKSPTYEKYNKGINIQCPEKQSLCGHLRMNDILFILGKTGSGEIVLKRFLDIVGRSLREEGLNEGIGYGILGSQHPTFLEEREKYMALKAENPHEPLYRCRKCGCGPISHKNCNDLKAHHGDMTRNGVARISNACPKCGNFEAHTSGWDLFTLPELLIDESRYSNLNDIEEEAEMEVVE